VRRHRDRPHKSIGEVPLARPAQHLLHVLLHVVAQGAIQLLGVDLAHLRLVAGPRQAIVERDIVVLEEQATAIGPQLDGGHRIPHARDEAHIGRDGRRRDGQPVQLDRRRPRRSEAQPMAAGRQIAQREAAHGQLIGRGQCDLAGPRAAGQGKGGRAVPRAIAHQEPRILHPRDQLERVLHPVAGLAAEPPADAAAVHEAMRTDLGPAPAVRHQGIGGPGGGEAQVGIIGRIEPDGARRQEHAGRPERLVGIGAHRRKVEIGHVVQDQVLMQIGVVDELAAHQAGVVPVVRRAKPDIAIDPVLPFQLVAIRETAQVGRSRPGMLGRFPFGVRHQHMATIEAREDAQIEAEAGREIGNVGDAGVLLGVWPPGGQAQVVGMLQFDHGANQLVLSMSWVERNDDAICLV